RSLSAWPSHCPLVILPGQGNHNAVSSRISCYGLAVAAVGISERYDPGSWGPARPPGPRLPEEDSKAAGEVLTAKQAPHRPGTAPTLGLRAGRVAVLVICRIVAVKHSYKGSLMTPVEAEAPRESADTGARPPERTGARPMREVRHEYTHTLPRLLSQ